MVRDVTGDYSPDCNDRNGAGCRCELGYYTPDLFDGSPAQIIGLTNGLASFLADDACAYMRDGDNSARENIDKLAKSVVRRYHDQSHDGDAAKTQKSFQYAAAALRLLADSLDNAGELLASDPDDVDDEYTHG